MKNKRVILISLLLALIALIFWSGSRYPQLNEKALMGGETPVQGIGFDMTFDVQPSDPWYTRITLNTLNWIDTNKKGMAFGILFAAGLFLLFAALSSKSFKGRFANSLLGLIIGAPLGVCVNCAAPIAQGIHAGGGRGETALATMTSSPTLNIVVLSMLFALFPMYMVALKVGLTIVFILVGIPLISWLFPRNNPTAATADLPSTSAGWLMPSLSIDASPEVSGEGWGKSFKWLLVNFGKSLWYIVKTTVPLMLLAGLLGNVLITFVPWDAIVNLMHVQGLVLGLLVLLVVAIIGTFLPVPIAFDVIITAVLMAAGLPANYAMALLFTLGIFSVYSFFITRQTLSMKVALGMFLMVVGFGFVAGLVGGFLDKQAQQDRHLAYRETFSTWPSPPREMQFPTHAAQLIDAPYIKDQPATPLMKVIKDDQGNPMLIQKTPFQPKEGKAPQLFTKKTGADYKINQPWHFSVQDLIEPFAHGRGIATGDIDQDGWQDFLLTTRKGITIYHNYHGKQFLPHQLFFPELNNYYIYSASLVDMNNDGWPDLFLTTYRHGNFLIYNREGALDAAPPLSIPSPAPQVLTVAPSFGDVNHDGDIDILLGNWSVGHSAPRDRSFKTSRDWVLLNKLDSFQAIPLGGMAGETLSSLLTDFNDDGHLDIILGNDFMVPDMYYLGDGQGHFKWLTKNDGILPATTLSTMSIACVDVNNDLRTDIYMAQNSTFDLDLQYRTDDPEKLCAVIPDPAERAACEKAMHKQLTLINSKSRRSLFQCSDEDRIDCIAYNLLFEAYDAKKLGRGQQWCDHFPAGWEEFQYKCALDINDTITYQQPVRSLAIPEIGGINMMLTQNGQGVFEDKAHEMGIDLAGWCWNARLADVDNDEWQDLYVANGFMWRRSQETNFFFRNTGQGQFELLQEGMDCYLPTNAYAYLDIERDGDLDLIVVPAIGPILVYQNNSQGNHTIEVTLVDVQGNRSGIGSKVIIHYGDQGEKHQMREIQAGGGFRSFQAPVAHFGLAQHDRVARIEILWSTQERSVLTGPFEVDQAYTISRPLNDI